MALYLEKSTGLVRYLGGHTKENVNISDAERADLMEIAWNHPANKGATMTTETPAAPIQLPVDRLVKIYLKMRDAKSQAVKDFEAMVKATYDDPMKTISTELKARAQAEGVDGFKTDNGTVYMSTSLKTSCQDWGIFYQWVKDNDALDFLERRISSGKVKDYMDANDGALPPGINIFRELDARVRRATEK